VTVPSSTLGSRHRAAHGDVAVHLRLRRDRRSARLTARAAVLIVSATIGELDYVDLDHLELPRVRRRCQRRRSFPAEVSRECEVDPNAHALPPCDQHHRATFTAAFAPSASPDRRAARSTSRFEFQRAGDIGAGERRGHRRRRWPSTVITPTDGSSLDFGEVVVGGSSSPRWRWCCATTGGDADRHRPSATVDSVQTPTRSQLSEAGEQSTAGRRGLQSGALLLPRQRGWCPITAHVHDHHRPRPTSPRRVRPDAATGIESSLTVNAEPAAQFG
jgi:hypothetical protein